jgi:hypothetical protein
MKTFLLLLLLTVLLTFTASPQPPFRVGIAIDSPPAVMGNCHPTVVRFTGRINATAPGEAQYQWVRSDGADTPVRTQRFTRPGPLAISYSWNLTRSYRGWMAFRIIYPNQAETRHVEFSVSCP